MVRIRLRKVGSKNQQSFRIVAAEREHPRDGRFLENLGMYNPRTNPATIELDEARVYHWLKAGAQPSDSVMQLLRSIGALERYTRFKAGEPVETLTTEAAAAATARHTSVRTGDSTIAARPSKKKKAAEKAAAAAA
jgi:small subunit ribosomal protein S16